MLNIYLTNNGDFMKNISDCILASDLIEVGSCVDMLCLHFSDHSRRYCLHVQSDWYIERDCNIIICKKDMYTDKNNGNIFNSYFNEYEMTNSVFACKVQKLQNIKALPLKVVNVRLCKQNSIFIEFNKGYSFYTYLCNNAAGELWRLFEKGNYNDSHLVAYETELKYE